MKHKNRRALFGSWALSLAAFAVSAFGGPSDGGLRVELITAYNLVVDSNAGTPASYAPRSAYIGVTFHNDGDVPLTDLSARIGDYKGGSGDTPGVYPTNTQAGLIGPLAGGAFALNHEGGSAGTADATRYIPSIPARGSVTVYWLVSYPQTDVNNVPTWGKSVKPDDDLKLFYDVWATAKEGVATRSVDLTRSFTCRNEISASANKIFPNGANKVPDYYKQMLNQYEPAWTNANYDGSVGSIISTDGVWYDFGNVGEGFDNNGDLVPDHNAWMQPVGDPSLFDPSAFRLVRTYAFVIVKLKTGGEIVLSGQDQLYFENIPENNGAVGYVRYQYMPLRSGASSVTTPYQEVASGRDNEKFNADYGVSLGEQLIAGDAHVTLDKTVDKAVAYPSNTLSYTVSYSNTGTVEVGNAQLGLPLVVQDAIPAGTVYVGGTAAAGNTLPLGVNSYQIFYSTNGGNSWTNAQPSPASAVTHLQWWLSDPLQAGAGGVVTFGVTINNPYTRSSPIILNTAGLSFGNTPPFLTDDAETRVLGNNSVGDTVYADTGVGAGGYLANGIQDGAELGIPNITVWLYADANSNGVVDASERLVATTNTASNGTYLFSQLADGRYVVVVDAEDPQMPAGYTSTTAERVAVNLDGARTDPNPVNVLTADFGFAPALVLTKRVEGSATRNEGDLVTFTITVTNNMPGNGTGVGSPATYTVFPTNGSSGTGGNKVFSNASNLWRPGEPDQTFATAPYKDASENVTLLSYYLGPQLGSPTNVAIQIPLRVNGSFTNNNSTLAVNVFNYGTQIGTSQIFCNTLTNGVLQYDITSYLTAWNWTNFNGSALSVELVSKKAGNPAASLDIDTVGFRVMSNQAVGGSGGTTTLDPVPLDDFYATNRLSYVSSSPAANSVTNSGATGVLHWENIGPIYPGGGRIVSVTFRTLEPPGNTTATTTNTASVTQAFFLNGREANDDEDQAGINVLPTGTIGDYVWRDLNANGSQDDGATGIAGVTVRLFTNSVLFATTTTDATGYYLFAGLTNSGTYIVRVDPTTLPGGSGTPTFDRDGTNTANVASNIVLNVTSTNGTDKVLNADFGYTLQSLIRGTIWHDRDRDAYPAPESGEELFGGVLVSLFTSVGGFVTNTTTSAGGTFQFVGPYSGSYYVQVGTNTGSLAVGTWALSYDTDTTTNGANRVTLTLPLGGERIADYSYYLGGTSAIGDTLYYDWNGDGVQSNGVDTGIADVTVYLFQDENTNGVIDVGVDALAGTTVTATNGWYLFPSRPSGAYIVVVDQADPDFPALYLNTADPYGAKDGRSAVTVNVSTNLLQDFGYQPYGFNSIGDTVWRDLNADRVQSGATETGISNVTVRLLMDFDGDSGYTLIQTAVTDAAGKYLFSSLPDGDYRVEVVTTSPGLPKDSFGHPYLPTTFSFYKPSVSGGVADLNNDFGFSPLGAIGDTVFWDSNVNGDQDWNETGIPGVAMVLYVDVNNNDVYDTGDIQYGSNVWTDASGRYLFTGLPPNEYVVQVVTNSPALGGAALSADPEMNGDPCPIPPPLVTTNTCDAATAVSILPGTSFMGADFGYRSPLGVLGDLLWIDMNTNGLFDAGEQGIPYVTVELYNGSDLVATNVTDADGYYIFSGLSNGTYRVTVLTNDTDFPLGLTAVYDVDGTRDNTTGNIVISGWAVTTINGQPAAGRDLDIDFGYRYAGNNSLSGTVGLDALTPTYDGLMNSDNPSGPGSGEYAFANVLVYLHLWNDDGDSKVEPGEYTQIASTLTDTAGDYSFTGMPAGDGNDRYIVALTAPTADLYLTTTNHAGIAVVNTTNAFGVTLSSYQTMPVTSSRDNVDFAFRSTAVRDFGDLPESYSTTVADQPVGPSHTQTASGPYLGVASTTTEANGQPSQTAANDGGEDGVITRYRWLDGPDGGTIRVQVSGTNGWLVGWIDFNQDGTFTNMNERVVEQAVNVGLQDFTFDIPAGTFTTNGPTVLNARFRIYPTAPYAPMFTGEAVGGEVEDHQFVFGIIGNRVWEDLNGNGVQDAGEPGVSNAVVRLYDAGGGIITNAVTAADGSYAFTGLPVTNYSLTFEQPSNTFFTARSAGSDAQLDSDANVTSGESGTVSLLGSADRRDIDAGLYVPAVVRGYVFRDMNGDLLRNTGDVHLTNVLVRLMVGGVEFARVTNDAFGYYEFVGVPAGTVSVLVSRVGGTLVGVPTQEPDASDQRRNRALPDEQGFDAYIVSDVLSGQGVLPERTAETLNFGFLIKPLSTALDISLYATSDGVMIELWTSNESGTEDIVIFAWLNGAWAEVGRVPSWEIAGEGSHQYVVRAEGLSPDGAYQLKVVDESGHEHLSATPIAVRTLRVGAVRLDMQTLTLAFNTEAGRPYVVKVSTDLVHWTTEYVSSPTAQGWSGYRNTPFTAGGESTQVRVPVNGRKQVFFKIVMTE